MTHAEWLFRRRMVPGHPAECWPWKGYRDPKGYGSFTDRTKSLGMQNVPAHRAAWILAHGPIPPEMCVCHRCDNPPCVNPAHLFLGTNRANQLDKIAKGRQAKRERHGRARLTRDQVAQIKRALQDGDGAYSIAKRYGVAHATIWWIQRGDHWPDVAAAS